MNQPNILLLLSDEHSFRYMGCVPEERGGESVDTPNLDRLASQAAFFTDTYCQMPLCTPSRMSLLSGREIRKCGAWWNDSVLRPELATIPEALEQEGYETCLVGKMHMGGTNQMAGFQRRPYGDLTGKTGHQRDPISTHQFKPYAMRVRTEAAGITEIPESQLQEHIVTEEGLAFIREHQHNSPDKPWFLCLSFSRPHFPLTAPSRHFERYWPDGFTRPRVGPTGDAYDHPMSVGMRKGFKADQISDQEMMKARAGYAACVSYLDEIIGDFLVRCGQADLLENTVIIYTSDHGEMAGEHGVWWKQGWYEACTRVPLLISLPEHRRGELPGSTPQVPVGLVDLMPTICSLTGAQHPPDLDGVDLSKSVTGESAPPDRPVFSDNLMPRWGEGTEFRMIRQGNYKYVYFRNAPPLLFDLHADPAEQVNLCQNPSASIREVWARFEKIAKETMNFDEAEQERLERDGSLADTYQLNVPESTGNLYWMSTGKLVNAEDLLYHPTVILDRPEDIFVKKS